MKQMEDRFNHWAGYDYVFLNDDVRPALSLSLYGVRLLTFRTFPTNSKSLLIIPL